MGWLKHSPYRLLLFFLLAVLPSCHRSAQPPSSSFSEKILVGGVVGGKIYLEVPLKPSFFANAKTPQEKTKLWWDFFEKAILEQPNYAAMPHDGNFVILNPAPYWGDSTIPKIDLNYVASAAALQIGDVFKIRTPSEFGSAKIIGYEIHHSMPADGSLLLAIAEPLSGFQPSDTHILVADQSLRDCKPLCASRRGIPNPSTSAKIREAIRKEANQPAGYHATEIIILEGNFTRKNSTQYIAYIRFGEYPDDKWQTTIFDSDLTVISMLGENEYAHIKPLAVGDINQDGFDEIWTELQGSEGRHFALWYWRGGSGKDAFRAIATAYDGL
ncbi:MAG TPA: hypothetical protein VGH16_02090 [Candidatus Binatia bacterium]|jgi:hypothetical protein